MASLLIGAMPDRTVVLPIILQARPNANPGALGGREEPTVSEFKVHGNVELAPIRVINPGFQSAELRQALGFTIEQVLDTTGNVGVRIEQVESIRVTYIHLGYGPDMVRRLKTGRDRRLVERHAARVAGGQ